MTSDLIYLALIGLFVFWLFGEQIKNAFSGTKVDKGGLASFMPLVIYAMFIAIAYFKFPLFWEMWNTPVWFFYLSNGILILSVLTIMFGKPFFGWTGLILGLFLTYFTIARDVDDAMDDSGTTGYNAVSTTAPVRVQRVKTSKTFYFMGGTAISVHLKEGWHSYPKGGTVTIQTPNGNTYDDIPGVDPYLGYQPEGIYVFTPDANATAVEIYNYW